jgi:hypothetical protein
MLIAGAIIFSALASAEVQPWARDDESAEGREMTTIEKPKGIEQKEPLLEEKRVVGDTAENGK